MQKITTILALTAVVTASCLCSCANKEQDDPKPAEQPTRQPVSQATSHTPPPADYNATQAFRTPDDDIKLPTDSQIAEGRDSSIGTRPTPGIQPDHAPSVSVTPPTPPATSPTPAEQPKQAPAEAPKPGNKEDQLDPQ